MAASSESSAAAQCQICDYHTSAPKPNELGRVRGNTERFRNTSFQLWKCPQCQTIYSLDPVDFPDIYLDYPLQKRQLDFFARRTMRNLLRRLKRAGLRRTDSILDYGCGNGIFIRFLNEAGYPHVSGYDPYVPEFAASPVERSPFDCVVANDVIEHCPDARALVRACAELVRPGGLLYIGTAESEGVEMSDLEPHIMRLHQPFHRIIFTAKTLQSLGIEAGMELIRAYRRSYMDTWLPFANYRFLDQFNKALGHNMDLAFEPAAGRILLRKPTLFFYAFFGYLLPSAYEPAVVLRKRS